MGGSYVGDPVIFSPYSVPLIFGSFQAGSYLGRITRSRPSQKNPACPHMLV